MAVDESQKRDDMYDVRLRSHDLRVEVGGWTYYIRGVRQTSELLPRIPAPIFEPLYDIPVFAARGLKWLTRRRNGWIVGVVRLGSVSTWNDVTPRLAYQEELPPGREPGARIAELVEEVEDGRFAPQR